MSGANNPSESKSNNRNYGTFDYEAARQQSTSQLQTNAEENIQKEVRFKRDAKISINPSDAELNAEKTRLLAISEIKATARRQASLRAGTADSSKPDNGDDDSLAVECLVVPSGHELHQRIENYMTSHSMSSEQLQTMPLDGQLFIVIPLHKTSDATMRPAEALRRKLSRELEDPNTPKVSSIPVIDLTATIHALHPPPGISKTGESFSILPHSPKPQYTTKPKKTPIIKNVQFQIRPDHQYKKNLINQPIKVRYITNDQGTSSSSGPVVIRKAVQPNNPPTSLTKCKKVKDDSQKPYKIEQINFNGKPDVQHTFKATKIITLRQGTSTASAREKNTPGTSKSTQGGLNKFAPLKIQILSEDESVVSHLESSLESEISVDCLRNALANLDNIPSQIQPQKVQDILEDTSAVLQHTQKPELTLNQIAELSQCIEVPDQLLSACNPTLQQTPEQLFTSDFNLDENLFPLGEDSEMTLPPPSDNILEDLQAFIDGWDSIAAVELNTEEDKSEQRVEKINTFGLETEGSARTHITKSQIFASDKNEQGVSIEYKEKINQPQHSDDSSVSMSQRLYQKIQDELHSDHTRTPSQSNPPRDPKTFAKPQKGSFILSQFPQPAKRTYQNYLTKRRDKEMSRRPSHPPHIKPTGQQIAHRTDICTSFLTLRSPPPRSPPEKSGLKAFLEGYPKRKRNMNPRKYSHPLNPSVKVSKRMYDQIINQLEKGLIQPEAMLRPCPSDTSLQPPLLSSPEASTSGTPSPHRQSLSGKVAPSLPSPCRERELKVVLERAELSQPVKTPSPVQDVVDNDSQELSLEEDTVEKRTKKSTKSKKFETKTDEDEEICSVGDTVDMRTMRKIIQAEARERTVKAKKRVREVDEDSSSSYKQDDDYSTSSSEEFNIKKRLRKDTKGKRRRRRTTSNKKSGDNHKNKRLKKYKSSSEEEQNYFTKQPITRKSSTEWNKTVSEYSKASEEELENNR